MINARIVVGVGDDETAYGTFCFAALPGVDEKLLIRKEGDLIPLRVVEVFHHPVADGAPESPSVVLRTEKR